MKAKSVVNDLEERAIGALCALLGEVSVVKLKELRRETRGSAGDIGLVAHVEVLGHSHTLACGIGSSTQPEKLRSSLLKLCDQAAHLDRDAMPVIIAPYLSPEARALCKESHAGFIDLEGNARIAIGEVFIGKRSLGPHAPHPSAASLAKALDPLVIKQFPRTRAAAKTTDYPPIAIPA